MVWERNTIGTSGLFLKYSSTVQLDRTIWGEELVEEVSSMECAVG